jgi:NAD(P)-dependent dehydrogenase (short-subunit alcohol dehydrogenase family)
VAEIERGAAMVTGASSGIGAATAARFASGGYAVVLVDIAEEGEEETARIRAAGGKARFVLADVSKTEEIAAAVEDCVAHYGRLDSLVNCAGTAGIGERLEALDESNFDQVMAVNVRGTMFAMRYAALAMKSVGSGGAIVNVASVAAMVGIEGQSTYAASKGAVVSATRVAALELGKFGIRVNVICPGMVLTKMMINSESFRSGIIEKAARRTPAGRLGNVDEIASTAFFLGTPTSGFITGAIVMADGGMSCGLY